MACKRIWVSSVIITFGFYALATSSSRAMEEQLTQAHKCLSENLNMKSHSIQTPYGKIAYWESSGSGPTIVFIHGNSASKEAFEKQFSALGDKYHLIAVDLPGHGQSDNAIDPEQTYTLPGYADAILSALNSMQIEGAVICGWSLGGHVAIEILSKRPDLAKGLLLTGTPPTELSFEGFKEGTKPIEGVMQLMGKDTNFTQDEARLFLEMGGMNPDESSYLVLSTMRADGRARNRLFFSAVAGIGVNEKEFIQNTTAPLAFILGQKDQGINNDYIKSLNYKNLYGMTELPGGHSCFWENSDEFNKALQQFVDAVYSR